MSKPKSTKKLAGIVRMQVPAGKAAPSQKIGTALGQRGVNIMEFCKAFNDLTKNMEQGAPVGVILEVYEDRSFHVNVKTPTSTYLLHKAAGIAKGSKNPGMDTVGKITMKQVHEIAAVKAADLTSYNKEAAAKMVIGSARSMGIEVID